MTDPQRELIERLLGELGVSVQDALKGVGFIVKTLDRVSVGDASVLIEYLIDEKRSS